MGLLAVNQSNMVYEVTLLAADKESEFVVMVSTGDMGSAKETIDQVIITAEFEFPKCQVTSVTLREDVAMLINA